MPDKESIAIRRQLATERITKALGVTITLPNAKPDVRHVVTLEQIADALDRKQGHSTGASK